MYRAVAGALHAKNPPMFKAINEYIMKFGDLRRTDNGGNRNKAGTAKVVATQKMPVKIAGFAKDFQSIRWSW